jgi:hypothetical protein
MSLKPHFHEETRQGEIRGFAWCRHAENLSFVTISEKKIIHTLIAFYLICAVSIKCKKNKFCYRMENAIDPLASSNWYKNVIRKKHSGGFMFKLSCRWVQNIEMICFLLTLWWQGIKNTKHRLIDAYSNATWKMPFLFNEKSILLWCYSENAKNYFVWALLVRNRFIYNWYGLLYSKILKRKWKRKWKGTKI